MDHDILYQPSGALLRLALAPGESVVAEGGAMVSKTAGVDIETRARGGILGSLKRAVMGGESFFLNTFTAGSGGEVTFAPTLMGDVTALPLQGETILAHSGAFLAASPDVAVDASWGGARTFFAGEGLTLLKLSGTGEVFLSSYGAIHPVELQAGETLTVDTGFILGFTQGVGFKVRRVGGLRSLLFSGEGLVVDLTGPGRVWIQTRSMGAFLAWLIPQLPQQRSG